MNTKFLKKYYRFWECFWYDYCKYFKAFNYNKKHRIAKYILRHYSTKFQEIAEKEYYDKIDAENKH